jgi:DNA-binding transcriptional LysR family regulator
MDPLSLRRLWHLVEVAECGTISAAAAGLNMSASALSASVKELERSVGVTLLIRRSGEGVSLTAEGARLLVSARELLVAAHDVQQLIATEVAGHAAPIAIGSLVTVAPIVLPRIVRIHRLRQPEVPVQIRAGAQDLLIDLLSSGTIHMAVTYNLGLTHQVAFEAVALAAPHVALPGDHPLAGEQSIRLSQVADEPFIALDLPLSREYFFSLLMSEGVEYEPRYAFADIELVRSAVGNGLGWALVNLVPPRPAAADGSRIVHVPLRTRHPQLHLGIVTLLERRQPASAGALVETIREAIGELVGP